MPTSDDSPATLSPSHARGVAAHILWALAALVGAAGVAGLAFLGLRSAGAFQAPVPTPACVESVLSLGEANYRVQLLPRDADGSISVPPDTPGVAYWIDGTHIHYVFALSPDALALMDTLKAGDAAIITWADCMTDTYQIETVTLGFHELAALTDQSTGGLTAFLLGESQGMGWVVRAGRPRPRVADRPTPPDEGKQEEEKEEEEDSEQVEGAIWADMAFGETVSSDDGATLTMVVTITNTGTTPFSLTVDELSLAPEGGEPLPPVSVEPALPQEILPGAAVTFEITFPQPGTPIALLRILDVTVDQYY